MTETTKAAAETLRATLTALPPLGTEHDSRIRKAITAAARALTADRDPQAAVDRVYRD
jgi:hypothetical protein